MDGEITRRSVLLECLSIMREELNICSSKYNGLEPKKGMEEAWEQAREKVRILQDLIHAYECEPVRAAIANWKKDVMENGPGPLHLPVYRPQTEEERKEILRRYTTEPMTLQPLSEEEKKKLERGKWPYNPQDDEPMRF